MNCAAATGKSLPGSRLAAKNSWGDGSDVNALLSSLILLFTIVAAVAFGVFSTYVAVTGILHAFAQQSQRRVPMPVLVQTHASGD